MHASRLLSILMLLQTRGRTSAQALAEETRVTVRTIYRDIDQLSAAGVPVWADRGRHGGFQLRDGWQTRLTGLTEAEASAIFMAGLPGPASELGLGPAIASAQLKLLAALPANWQADAQRVRTRFHLDAIDWLRTPPPHDHLQTIALAVWSERRLKIEYESWTDVATRDIEPLGLVLKAGVWYLVAGSGHEPRGYRIRTYRVSSIRDPQVRAERFTRPRGFDLPAYWAQATRRFEAGLYRGFALVRVTSAGYERVKAFSAIVAEAAECTLTPTDDDGWGRVTVPIESVEHAAREMMRLGSDGEVLEPPELRERIANTVRHLAMLYGDRPDEDS